MSCWEKPKTSIKDFNSGIDLPANTIPEIPNTFGIKQVNYVVRKGDTISKIASKYKGVTYQDIAKANGITNPNNIYVGQKLKIPNQTSVPQKPSKPIHEPISDDTSTGECKNTECKKCYCKEQNIITTSCNGKGVNINNNHFETLANELGVEKEVLKAVALTETGNRGAFQRSNPRHATILYERHYMKRFLKAKFSASKVTSLQKKYPNLIGSQGNYGKFSAQITKLERAKKLDKNSAIKSCSWGRFQVMGKYYNYLYSTPQELEKAHNQCELQHLALFKEYLKKHNLIKPMREKNWNTIAYRYNGAGYKKNNYHIKMKTKYNQLKKNW
jgi:hypothetical protein